MLLRIDTGGCSVNGSAPLMIDNSRCGRICAGTVVCPNTTYIAYRQGREMHTLVQLDVEYYNLGYNHP